MGVFRKRAPNHLIPIDADNAASKDWVILLEAGTIVGPSPDRLRVARSTLEKKVVRRYGLPFNVRHFLEVEGYDPRIHAVYFCPQLYKYDPEKKLVPLQGDEIGKLIAQALASGVKERRPWYEPSEKLPSQPIINTPADEFETLVVDMPTARTANDKKPDGGGGKQGLGCVRYGGATRSARRQFIDWRRKRDACEFPGKSFCGKYWSHASSLRH